MVTNKNISDSLEGIYSILKFFCDIVEKLKTAQDSLRFAAVEGACKMCQNSMNDLCNVK